MLYDLCYVVVCFRSCFMLYVLGVVLCCMIYAMIYFVVNLF